MFMAVGYGTCRCEPPPRRAPRHGQCEARNDGGGERDLGWGVGLTSRLARASRQAANYRAVKTFVVVVRVANCS